MLYDYFHYTELDKRFYEEHLKERLPKEVMDSHTHLNLPEHIRDVPPERIQNDWALQSGLRMTADDAAYYYKTLFPENQFSIVSFPFPVKEVHMEENNAYVAKCAQNGKIARGLMCVKPEYSCEYIQQQIMELGFSGLKPYPDMVSGAKGAEIGIFDFFPHQQMALAERMGLPVVMHLPRAGRMPDENNIRELKELRQRYPDLKMVIAHFGRCYTPYHFKLALDRLGSLAESFYFDTAAVLNPEVLRIGFDRLPADRILFGTDEPIFLWHGYREWTKTQYVNLAREEFPWNTHHKSAKDEANYTFFVYRQIDNILSELERFGANEHVRNAVFRENCLQVFSQNSAFAKLQKK